MRDELYDRDYQLAREDLHSGIDRLIGRISEGVRQTFEAIHRVEWAAPWNRGSKRDFTGIA